MTFFIYKTFKSIVLLTPYISSIVLCIYNYYFMSYMDVSGGYYGFIIHPPPPPQNNYDKQATLMVLKRIAISKYQPKSRPS